MVPTGIVKKLLQYTGRKLERRIKGRTFKHSNVI